MLKQFPYVVFQPIYASLRRWLALNKDTRKLLEHLKEYGLLRVDDTNVCIDNVGNPVPKVNPQLMPPAEEVENLPEGTEDGMEEGEIEPSGEELTRKESADNQNGQRDHNASRWSPSGWTAPSRLHARAPYLAQTRFAEMAESQSFDFRE